MVYVKMANSYSSFTGKSTCWTSASGKQVSLFIRELKQQRRRRLRKRHLKGTVALPQTLSCLFHLVQFVKCWQFFAELNSKRQYESSGKEK